MFLALREMAGERLTATEVFKYTRVIRISAFLTEEES